MITITKIYVNDFKGKKSYKFTLSDGITGYVDAKDAEKFREGDSITYSKEVKQNKKGEDYNMLTVSMAGGTTQSQPSTIPIPARPTLPVNIPGVPSSKADLRAKVPFHAMDKVIQLIVGGKLPLEKVQSTHKELCTYLYDEIESCLGEG